MYGLTEDTARVKATELARRYPENKYEVAVHGWTDSSWLRPAPIKPLTWGVKEYVPYCETMPWRLNGFVWFPRNFSTLSPR